MSRGSSGHKSNNAKRKWREKWNKRHPEGHKEYARFRRKLKADIKRKKDASKIK